MPLSALPIPLDFPHAAAVVFCQVGFSFWRWGGSGAGFSLDDANLSANFG